MHSRRTPRQTGNPSHQHRPAASERASRGSGERWLYGRHTVTAALANPERRWRRLAVLAGQETEAQQMLAAAVAERRGGDGAALDIFDRDAFSALLPPGAVHQGLALEVEPLPEPDLDGAAPGNRDRFRAMRHNRARSGQRSAKRRRGIALGRGL